MLAPQRGGGYSADWFDQRRRATDWCLMADNRCRQFQF